MTTASPPPPPPLLEAAPTMASTEGAGEGAKEGVTSEDTRGARAGEADGEPPLPPPKVGDALLEAFVCDLDGVFAREGVREGERVGVRLLVGEGDCVAEGVGVEELEEDGENEILRE